MKKIIFIMIISFISCEKNKNECINVYTKMYEKETNSYTLLTNTITSLDIEKSMIEEDGLKINQWKCVWEKGDNGTSSSYYDSLPEGTCIAYKMYEKCN